MPPRPPRGQTYRTLDNGGMPFCVHLDGQVASVYRRDRRGGRVDINSDAVPYTVLVKRFDYVKAFIGKSRKTPMTVFSASYGPENDGNSILLKLNERQFAFIGFMVYVFTLKKGDEILSFSSPVWNNGVPYPTASSKLGVYFLAELDRGARYVPNKYIPADLTTTQQNELYGLFYGGLYGSVWSRFAPVKRHAQRVDVQVIEKRLM